MAKENAQGKAQQMGGAKDGRALPTDDPNRDTAAPRSRRGGGGVGGGLPRDGGPPYGKDLGQLVAKQLEYQLAYHSSSVDWYEKEIERCEAEIIKNREAAEWHRHYLAEAQTDLEDFLAPLSSDETSTAGE